MKDLSVGVLVLTLEFPGCASLKDKRSRLKPLLARLHREFNLSAAEVSGLDSWQSTTVACALVSNDPSHTRRSLQAVVPWIETYWPDASLIDDHIELL